MARRKIEPRVPPVDLEELNFPGRMVILHHCKGGVLGGPMHTGAPLLFYGRTGQEDVFKWLPLWDYWCRSVASFEESLHKGEGDRPSRRSVSLRMPRGSEEAVGTEVLQSAYGTLLNRGYLPEREEVGKVEVVDVLEDAIRSKDERIQALEKTVKSMWTEEEVKAAVEIALEPEKRFTKIMKVVLVILIIEILMVTFMFVGASVL